MYIYIYIYIFMYIQAERGGGDEENEDRGVIEGEGKDGDGDMYGAKKGPETTVPAHHMFKYELSYCAVLLSLFRKEADIGKRMHINT
jgi:hypothetical protein